MLEAGGLSIAIETTNGPIKCGGDESQDCCEVDAHDQQVLVTGEFTQRKMPAEFAVINVELCTPFN